MKKLLAGLAAGFFAMALVSSADAATGMRVEATKGPAVVKQNTSSVYNMSIKVNDHIQVQELHYVYSPSILFTPDLLNYLNTNFPGMTNLLPAVSNEMAIAYFKAMRDGGLTQLYNGGGGRWEMGWGYGGVNNLDAFTLLYWDSIVDVATNSSIVPGRNLSIKTPQGIDLIRITDYNDVYYKVESNQAAVDKFYNDNKSTFVNESIASQESYGYVDGVLTRLTQDVITRENVDIYNLSVVKDASPLVLDMSGSGKLQASKGQHLPHQTIDLERTIITDFYGDGFEIAMEWVGPNDGLLVEPKADGTVDMSCLFGTAGGYDDGYEKLSLYADKNGIVSGDILKKLSVWQDANGNGKADAGEVKSCASLGITSINTKHKGFVSSFEMNGKTQKMWDWWPSAAELHKVASK